MNTPVTTPSNSTEPKAICPAARKFAEFLARHIAPTVDAPASPSPTPEAPPMIKNHLTTDEARLIGWQTYLFKAAGWREVHRHERDHRVPSQMALLKVLSVLGQ